MALRSHPITPNLSDRLPGWGRLALRGAVRAARALDSEQRPQLVVDPRHPMVPAAVRVERSRSSISSGKASQTAVTMWFGQGPALPSPGGQAFRGALRVGAGVAGVAALAALGVVAAQASAERQRLAGSASLRLGGPDSAKPSPAA